MFQNGAWDIRDAVAMMHVQVISLQGTASIELRKLCCIATKALENASCSVGGELISDDNQRGVASIRKGFAVMSVPGRYNKVTL
jgi:hypothetical protein